MAFDLERAIKRLPGGHRAYRRLHNFVHRRELGLLRALAPFAPNSAGRPSQLLDLALTDARQFFGVAEQVLQGAGRALLPIENVEDFPEADIERKAARDLALLFERYGSDKSTAHDYHLVYGPIFARTPNMRSVLEIGLGTNFPDVVSNMSGQGSPGASLRAFRDYGPGSVYGADVDRRVLFEEERIQTFFVDQTRLGTFDELSTQLPTDLGLVIDDGLHSPAANLAVLNFAMKHTCSRGWVVVEDIAVAAVPAWQLVAAVIADAWDCRIIAARDGHLFVAQRRV